MPFKVGQVVYTKAGKYGEVIQIEESGEYPVIIEVTSGNESNLIGFSYLGEYIIGKKTTMDIDMTL